MKKAIRNMTTSVVRDAGVNRHDEGKERLYQAAFCTEAELLQQYRNSENGFDEKTAEEKRDEYGENVITYGKKHSAAKRLCGAFINPFTVVLLALAVISVFTDIVFAEPGARNYATVSIITVMVLISGILRFVQETRSGNVAEKLTSMIHTTATVLRDGEQKEILMDEIVAGDLVFLSAGDMIPADLRILRARDLFVSQSALTGESEPVEKCGAPADRRDTLTDMGNLAFMGSNVVSGSAMAIVIAVGQ